MKSSKHTKFSTSPHRENPFGPLSVCLGIWKFLIKLSVSSFGLAIAGILSYIALALTYSRSSYLAFIVGIGTTFLFRRSFKFFIIILLVLSLTLTVLPRPSGEGVKLERKASTIARLSSWNKALKIIKDHPIFGVGFNAYRYAQRDYGFLEKRKWQEAHAGGGADSSLLFVAATTGIVGFFAYLWLWGEITILSFKLSVVQKPWGVISLASILALLIHSLFLNSLFYPWVMIWVWVLLALPV